jgi:hypothetical protein
MWLGGPTGNAWYASKADEVLPTASAIKTAFLVELFGRYHEALDQPPPGLDEILADGHPAIAHFEAPARAEIRRSLQGATVRTIGKIMMGSEPAPNLVYNAAANVTTALLGGPEELTRAIHRRDPALRTIAVRRYMLADRRAHGDNEATPEALAAVLQRLSNREVPGLDHATLEAVRGAVLSADDPSLGRHFHKNGDLSSDPITHVESGWFEGPDHPPVVYVVMLAQADPQGLPRAEAHRQLVARCRELTHALLQPVRALSARP